jgi:hypothetical protein
MRSKEVSLIKKFSIHIGSITRATILLLAIGGSMLASGCQDAATIWSAEAKSPDGYWIANAQTVQYGGLGTAGVQTTVYLSRVNSSSNPIEILNFSNNSAYPSGKAKVNMNWVTATHLNVSYNEHTNVYFQAIKCANIDISVSRLSN